TYDERGRQTEYAYYGLDDQLINSKSGIARMQFLYGNGQQPIDRIAFDATGERLALEVFIKQLTPGGAGQRLGLRQGDAPLRYDGKLVPNLSRFIHQRSLEKPGDPPRPLVVRRIEATLTASGAPGAFGVSL